jgi:hypothetical protein
LLGCTSTHVWHMYPMSAVTCTLAVLRQHDRLLLCCLLKCGGTTVHTVCVEIPLPLRITATACSCSIQEKNAVYSGLTWQRV